MFFQRIKTPGLAHNAYLIASNSIGILVDPRRDIDEYLETASRNGIAIKYVLETHRQEDFVLGSSAVKEKMGAQIIGGEHDLFRHCDIRLKDSETMKIEDFTIKALWTPGHTPESMSYALYLKDRSECWAVFTGDALFIGEAGRTDLPDQDKTAENGAILYDMIQTKLLPLGPQCLIYPAHGSGSICGGSIAEYDESTLGFEMEYNPAFKLSKEEFIDSKLRDRIPRPPYFSLMEQLNLQGGKPIVEGPLSVRILRPQEFAEECQSGIIIDTRLPEAFAGGHIPGSYSIWLEGLSVFGGYLTDQNTKIYLVQERPEDIEKAYYYLARIGLDRIEGSIVLNFEKWRNEGMDVEMCPALTPSQIAGALDKYEIIDVREINEFEEGHIPGAINCFVGSLGKFLDENTFSKPILVTCSVGHRGSLGTSIFLKKGYKNVTNLLGGMKAWKKLNLPIEMEKEEGNSYFYKNRNSGPEYINNQLH